MAIVFRSEGTSYLPRARRKIRAWVQECVDNEGYRSGDITFVFCAPAYHIDINRRYLGHDYHTDVITFDYSDLQNQRIVAGDILIDPVRVREQSAEWGTDKTQEELRVIIHGVLHLCGYGDKLPEEQELMRKKEDFYLTVFEEKYT